ncbi:MAG: thioesterase family protein [Acidobacteriota bacterium]
MGDRRKDEEALALVHSIFEKRIPFNKVLGVTIDRLTFDRAALRFSMREELVGNYLRQSLHGGVIAAALDLTGGLVAFLSAIKGMEGEPAEKKMERLASVGTIDLRVDYLRPGTGRHFLATGFILRAGNKVAVTRMELHNDKKSLIAVGTGAYMVG